ncbi:MAG: RIO kinase 1, partial [Myxococcota bacterium]
MKVPRQLQPLVHDGLIDSVVRPLMTGKEAAVYVVIANGELCCAKAYKDADHRSFKNRANYQEGRSVRNSRRGRAMQRGTKYGKRELEENWQNAEVDALYRLAGAGVRVPKPLNFAGGVLIMELVVDEDGDVAPRLNDVSLTEETAKRYHQVLLRDVVKMLCAGLIHGDLSEYNVLVDADGPVIIDLPQAVDAAANNNAERMLRRDVGNLAAYFSRFAPEIRLTDYGREIWDLYAKGELVPNTVLTGRFEMPKGEADVGSVLQDIDDARKDNERRKPRSSNADKGNEAWRGVVPDAEPSETPAGRSPRQKAKQEPKEMVVSPTGTRKIVDLRAPTKPKPLAREDDSKKKRR